VSASSSSLTVRLAVTFEVFITTASCDKCLLETGEREAVSESAAVGVPTGGPDSSW
jgi:hypothetical protein